MQTNALPRYDMSDNPTGCCPRFDPAGWDGQHIQLRDLPVVRAETHGVMHVPLDMGKVFGRVMEHIRQAGAEDTERFVVLSRDLSALKAEHLFAVTGPVPGEETTALTGDFVTKVFEGPYRDARRWHAEMLRLVRARGHEPGKVWFFYTTCPRCAKVHGRNYVVGFGEMTATPSAVL